MITLTFLAVNPYGKDVQKTHTTATRKLSPGQKIIEHGIPFERLTDGDGRFSVNVMVDGQRIHRVIGRESDGTTRSQAEEFINRVKNEAKHDRLSLPKGRKLSLSFRQAATKYIARLNDEGGRDMSKKRRRLELHLVPFFGDTPLSKISTFDIQRYKKHRIAERAIKSSIVGTEHGLKKTAAAQGTINRELAVLSHLLNKAIEWRWIDRRPAKIERYNESSGRITYLTVEQVERLVECAKDDENTQIYPFIVIALETSMRMTEILSIRKENVNLHRRVIYIPEAKAGSREQPITAHLAEFLAPYLQRSSSPWLFPSDTAKNGHAVNIRKPFRRVVEAAGLDPTEVVRHTLRHTAITHLVQAGVDLPTVKRISGHKTLAMVERYSHQNGEHIRAAMSKLERRYRDFGD
ncbi:MAG: tyrosine-type recombinase/integrase [Gammaproteobacteria bacterium]